MSRGPLSRSPRHSLKRLPFLPEHAIPACSQGGIREVFALAGDADARTAIAVCRKICSRCPFREPCERFAIDTHQQWGVWGGRLMRPTGHRKVKAS